MKKTIYILVIIIVFSVFLNGLVAYFTDKDSIKNKFITGNIKVDINEDLELDLRMIPGKEIYKNPKITIKKTSIPAYIFVDIEAENNINEFIEYEINEELKVLPNSAVKHLDLSMGI